MKKNFFKKLSFVLAFAMVATSVAPAASASAAAAPNLAKRYVNVYEGKTYSYAAKNAAGYTVKWVVSGKGAKYASLSKKTGAKTVLSVDTEGAVAAKNAPVVVTAKFYKGKKLVKAAGDAIKVKVSATAVDIVTKADATKIAADESVKFSRKITPANATSVTYWSVTDKDGKATTAATIDGKGNFKATELGDYVIVAETKNAKNGKVIAKDTQEVKVVLAIKSAAQETVKKLAVNFNAKLPETVKLTDFSIVKDSNNQSIAISEIKVDGKKVTVSTYQKINDGASYTVKYGDSSVAFVASNNVVATIAISPATIPNNKLTKIKVATVDANGIELDSYDYNSNDMDSKIEFKIETTKGYTSGSELLLFAIGDTAKATATYHTYKYDDKGNETGAVKAEVTITAVDQSTAVDSYKYTIDKSTDTPDWDDVKINTKLAQEDFGYSIYFTAKDASDNDLTDYKLVSSDTDVLIVGSTSTTQSQGQTDTDTVRASLSVVAQGNAYVLVQDDDKNTVLSLPVSIVAKRKATAMTLSSYVAQLSTTVDDTKEIKVEVFDQFGDKMDNNADVVDVECISAPNTVTKQTYTPGTNAYMTIADDKVTFNGQGLTTGTYQYRIKASDEKITRTVEIKISAPDTNKSSTYKLIVSNGSVDTKFEKATDSHKTVDIRLAEFKGDVVKSYIPLNGAVSVKIVDPDGNDLSTGSTTAGVYEIAGTNSDKITYYARYVDGTQVGKDGTGSYRVEVNVPANTIAGVTNDLKFTSGFAVTDTQPKVNVVRDKDATDHASSFSAALDDAFKFFYDGDEVTSPVITDYKVIDSYGVIEAKDNRSPVVDRNYRVVKVTFEVVIDGCTVPVTYEFANNSSIRIK